MRLLLDPLIFNDQVYGGISRYYTEIFSNLSKRKDVIVEVPIIATNNIYLKESNLFGKEYNKHALFIDFLARIGISVRKKIRKINTNKSKFLFLTA